MAKIERRMLAGFELRADGAGDEMALVGYAALFNSESKDLGGFKEIIAPGAFTRTLKEGGEVKALVNHDVNQILGRTKNGTLTLEQDARGLKFRCVLNEDDPDAMALYARVNRGDLDECSFAFSVAPDGQKWSADYQTRLLTDIDLFDISVVASPAYNGTGVTARTTDTFEVEGNDAAAAKQRQWLADQQADWARKDKTREIGSSVLRDLKLTPEKRGNEDYFAARATEVCSAMGLDYCDHDNDFIFAADADDENEENCYRFAYECDEDGNPVLDEDSRTAVKHDLTHSERGRKVLAERRQRKADNELRARLRKQRGIHSGI